MAVGRLLPRAYPCFTLKLSSLFCFCCCPLFFFLSKSKDWRKQALEEPGTLSAAVGALYSCNETVEADRIYVEAIRRKVLPDPASGATWAAAAARTAAANVRGVPGARTTPTPEESGYINTALSQTSDCSQSRGRREQTEDIRGQQDSRAGSRRSQERQRGGRRVERETAAEAGRGNTAVLWVDVRRAPVEVIPAVVTRVVQALKEVGAASDGLVVEWGGGRLIEGKDDSGAGIGRGAGTSSAERGGRSPRSAARAGRRQTLIELFAAVEPAIEVIESSTSRGQVRTKRTGERGETGGGDGRESVCHPWLEGVGSAHHRGELKTSCSKEKWCRMVYLRPMG